MERQIDQILVDLAQNPLEEQLQEAATQGPGAAQKVRQKAIQEARSRNTYAETYAERARQAEKRYLSALRELGIMRRLGAPLQVKLTRDNAPPHDVLPEGSPAPATPVARALEGARTWNAAANIGASLKQPASFATGSSTLTGPGAAVTTAVARPRGVALRLHHATARGTH